MNSCVLMAEIVQDPQLRYTADSQTPITEMMVELPGLKADDPPTQLKVVGWGNLAQEIQERYHQGDRIIIEGRLNMNTVDRPEGFKEKRAELTAQRIHTLDFSTSSSAPMRSTTAIPSSVSELHSQPSSIPSSIGATAPATAEQKAKSTTRKPQPYVAPAAEPNYDDIPF